MSSTLNFKTCELLAHLRDRLPRAVVDYQRSGAMHRFQIDCAGLIYQVSFPEQVIDSTEEQALKRMLRPVVERALLGAAPRRIFVGTMAHRRGDT